MAKLSTSKIVSIAIVLLLMFGLQFVPPVGPLTPTGMHVLGIFLGAVIGWSTVDLIWTSILAMISMGFVDGYTLASVTAAGFGSGTFWTILFMLMFVMAFERAGGTSFIAVWLITRKFSQGKPVAFTFMFLFAAFLVGMLNGIAACLLFYTVLYSVCAQVGYKPHDKYPSVMILGITFAAMFGSISHSLLGSPLILADAFRAASGIELTLAHFITVCWPFSVFMLLVFSFAIKYVFRCDLKPLQDVDVESVVDMSVLKITPRLKVMMGFTVVLIAGIASTVLLPTTWKVAQVINTLGLQGIAMILLAILTWWKVEEKFLFDFKEYTNTIQWDCLFIGATIMPLSSMLTMQGTGINELITSVIGGSLASLPPAMFVAVVLLVGAILTNFGNNVSICILLMPVILSVCGTLGIDPAPLYMVMIFAVHLAMLTPGACPYAALVWGNPEWITPGEIYKYASVMMIIFYILIIVVGYQWAQFML